MTTVRSLDHVTILTQRLDETAAFFEDVLGLQNRPQDRPAFDVDGAWLFLGDQAVVHLIVAGDDDYGRARGHFDHVAFRTDDFEGLVGNLVLRDIDHRIDFQPMTGLKQVFFREPNGTQIEVTCPA